MSRIARKLRQTLRGRTPFLRRQPGVATLPVLSAEELEHAFQKERCRVDRTQRGCALVAVQIDRSPSGAVEITTDILRDRCRLSDTLGQLGPDILVALLPETSGSAAWSFADDVRDLARAQGVETHCKVFCYPTDWTQGGSPRNGSVDSSSDDSSKGGTARVRESFAPSGSYAEFAQAIADPPNAASPTPPTQDGGRSTTTAPRQRGASLEPSEEETAVLCADDVAQLQIERPVGDLRPMISHPLPLWKRTIDVAVSGTLLVLLSPIFFVVGLAVKTTSRGPIIFKQKRMGEGGRPFSFYKFRSMFQDAEARKQELMDENEADGPVFKIKNDPRLTAIGRILRSTSLDELPQLWNVFKGDMTLVGPRPPTLDEVPRYELWQLHRLATRGGITCIWQVSGRSDIKFMQWARMDLQYLATKSFWTDLTLLWRTMSAVVSRKGAY